MRRARQIAPIALACCLLAAGQASARTKPFSLPRVKHLFVIVLENKGYESTFGNPSADPYLAQTLPAQGALLQNYYATGHESNDNYVSLISGQPPNAENQADCQVFSDFAGGVTLPSGVEAGTGCLYPAEVQNVGTQLTAAGKNWKAYQQDMGNDPNRETAACGHPAVNGVDETQKATAGDGYASRHDPFVYFHSVIGEQTYCDAHVVALGSPSGAMPAAALKGETGLAKDLLHTGHTPALSFITPNLCEDGHDFPCTNQAGGASALADIDGFLETWIPKIEASPAYRHGGLIEVTFDESDGPESDSSSCCGETPGPGSPMPGINGPGGGRVGAVLISPYIVPGTLVSSDYNHYSSLASWEQLFGLGTLADAAGAPRFGSDVFTAAK